LLGDRHNLYFTNSPVKVIIELLFSSGNLSAAALLWKLQKIFQILLKAHFQPPVFMNPQIF
jgi:hypothetical protein